MCFWMERFAMEIDGMSLKELRDLRGKVDRAISTFKERKKREAMSAAEEAAKAHGFNLAQLTGSKAKVSQTVAPKYSHPEDPSQTWTGRGRKPKWVAEALESGKSLEDLAI
jgi:DNA-binding protein H-NS